MIHFQNQMWVWISCSIRFQQTGQTKWKVWVLVSKFYIRLTEHQSGICDSSRGWFDFTCNTYPKNECKEGFEPRGYWTGAVLLFGGCYCHCCKIGAPDPEGNMLLGLDSGLNCGPWNRRKRLCKGQFCKPEDCSPKPCELCENGKYLGECP